MDHPDTVRQPFVSSSALLVPGDPKVSAPLKLQWRFWGTTQWFWNPPSFHKPTCLLEYLLECFQEIHEKNLASLSPAPNCCGDIITANDEIIAVFNAFFRQTDRAISCLGLRILICLLEAEPGHSHSKVWAVGRSGTERCQHSTSQLLPPGHHQSMVHRSEFENNPISRN